MIAEVAIVSAAVVACFAIADRRAEREGRTARELATSGERIELAAQRARDAAELANTYAGAIEQLQREHRALVSRVTAVEMAKGGMR